MTDASNSERSIESVLQANWPLPIWATILLATAIVGLATGLYWTERGGASNLPRILLACIRSFLLGLVVWMIAGWSWLQFRSDKPELLLVVDRSASMETRDMPEPNAKSDSSRQRRLDTVADLLEQLDSRQRLRLENSFHLRWFFVDEGIEPAELSLKSAAKELHAITATGAQSKLGDGLATLLSNQAGRGTAAIAIFTDGINTSGLPLSNAAAQARSAAIPIYAVATGRELAFPDIRLADLLMDEVVFLGDQVTLQVTAIASDVAEAKATIRLRDASSGDVLDREEIQFTKQRNQQQLSLSFVTKRSGEIPLQIDISEIAGETNLENNSLQRTLQVQDRKLRVLFVQRFPSLEFRFLKNLLERSQATDAKAASFELNTVLQEADVEYVQQDASAKRLVPSDPETLASYDVFVFGDIGPDLISRSAQQSIYEQVTVGGAGCIFVAGRDTPLQSLVGWPIGDLLPVQLGGRGSQAGSLGYDGKSSQAGSLGYDGKSSQASSLGYDGKSSQAGNLGSDQMVFWNWSPTSLGSSALPLQLADSPEGSAKIWSAIPPVASVFSALTPKLGSQVLAVGHVSGRDLMDPQANRENGLPILVSQFAGAGRVALQATDETYRWTTFAGSDRYHQRYWEQMLRWLCRGRLSGGAKESQLSIEPRRSKFGQPIRFELNLRGESNSAASHQAVELMLEDSNGSKTPLALSRDVGAQRTYTTTKSDLLPGNYRAVVFQPSLQKPPSENFAIVTPPGEQANLRSDWSALKQLAEQSRGKFYTTENSGKLFSELPQGRPTRFGTLPPIPIWNQPWVPTLFVVLIACEWLLRRKLRML
jgi:uncharacterized membrane protein